MYRVYSAGRVYGAPDGNKTYFRYLTAAGDTNVQNRELSDLTEVFVGLAETNGDSIALVGAVERPFRFGIIAPVTRVRTVTFANRLGRWVRR